MNSLRSHTAAFTGHRSYCGEADPLLAETVRALYGRGYRNFLSGMAEGFDLAAAEVVLSLRKELSDLRLVCVLPYSDHPAHRPSALQSRYQRGNDYLVDHASYLVAWYDGSVGGTQYTVRRAHAAHLPVENLWPDPQLKFIL